MKEAVLAHFADKPKAYFLKGIELLIKRCNKRIEGKREYIEKLLSFSYSGQEMLMLTRNMGFGRGDIGWFHL